MAEVAVGPAASAPRTFRLTVRARLALTYAVLLAVAGAVLLLIIAVIVGLVPTYEFATPLAVSGTTADTLSVQSVPAAALPTEAFPEYAETTDVGLLAGTTGASAVVVSSRADIVQLLLWVSAGALVLLVAGGAWAGWFVAGRMLRPLQAVNRAAGLASHGHLDHRIALGGPRDEITDLADTFDAMLAALERSVNADRRFAANASHELRTPLATTRAMLDVALTSRATADMALLERLREMNERSIDTVEALLDLSQVDSAEPGRRAPVELAALAASVADEAGPEADRSGIRVSTALGGLRVDGEAQLLRQLVANLVQNAIRHNVPGGFVTVTTDAASSTLVVENGGVVLDASAVATFTAPFTRGGGRTRDAADRGRGLGLSIVAAIADRHDAGLELAPRPGGGLRATVRFPR